MSTSYVVYCASQNRIRFEADHLAGRILCLVWIMTRGEGADLTIMKSDEVPADARREWMKDFDRFLDKEAEEGYESLTADELREAGEHADDWPELYDEHLESIFQDWADRLHATV